MSTVVGQEGPGGHWKLQVDRPKNFQKVFAMKMLVLRVSKVGCWDLASTLWSGSSASLEGRVWADAELLFNNVT